MTSFTTILSLVLLYFGAVHSYPFKVDVDAGGTANAFGHTVSDSDFNSKAGVQNGQGYFTAGGRSRGLSLRGGDSRAYVAANGKVYDGPFLRSAGELESEASAYGNLGSGSNANGHIQSYGDLVEGHGNSNSWGVGYGSAGARSGSRIGAVDRLGARGASASGSASGVGDFVNARSNSGTAVGAFGAGAHSSNGASSSGRGYSSASSQSRASGYRAF